MSDYFYAQLLPVGALALFRLRTTWTTGEVLDVNVEGQHFVIYDLVPQGIVVLAIQHQVRDIETLIADQDQAWV